MMTRSATKLGRIQNIGMRCLIVTAHPLNLSLCQTLSNAAIDTLMDAKHQCRHVDLYRSGFFPALTPAERASYYSGFETTEVAKEIEDLLWAETIVLIFPTWWFGPPAILKGWFDTVWVPGIAYDHAADLGAIQPRLRQLRKVVAITTLGSPWWVDWLILRRPVRRVLKTAILNTCAPQASLTFLSFYKVESLPRQGVDAAINRIRSMLQHL
ncbi:NAD(P)H-dependent oxidoreductase [Mesorhizobium sp. M0678]|uniref:NAD(P)H-dependent oxidoreductase n=2 Tax=unclassified Mesorhizobium TaxID=325217 RepID=UPI003334B50F